MFCNYSGSFNTNIAKNNLFIEEQITISKKKHEAMELICETGKSALKARWQSTMECMQKGLHTNKSHIIEYTKHSLLYMFYFKNPI